jgi:hypothetical protein
VPFVNPVTINGEDDPEAVFVPQLENAVYEEIAPPPTQAGAVNATET